MPSILGCILVGAFLALTVLGVVLVASEPCRLDAEEIAASRRCRRRP